MNADFPKIWQVLTEHFQLGTWSIHGPSHWQRVLQNGIELAEVTKADETVVRLFAVFHDSCRRNESTDPKHGQRAAQLALDLHGDLYEVEDHQLEFLMEACAGHHLGETTDLVTVGTCWDADRLDLTRCGMTPDMRYMSTDEGKRRAREFRSTAF